MTDLFDPTLFVSATITLVVIMDPPGTVPVFLALMGRRSKLARANAARQSVLVSLGVIAMFAIGGEAILRVLGIGIPALEGAGGLLLLLIALDLLTGKGMTEHEATEDVNVALVPLGTPLLAGPGAIAATILYARQADGRIGSYIALACAILAVHFLLWTCLRYSGIIIKLIKESGIMLLAKVAGLLLAAIAVQMVANAVRSFVSGV